MNSPPHLPFQLFAGFDNAMSNIYRWKCECLEEYIAYYSKQEIKDKRAYYVTMILIFFVHIKISNCLFYAMNNLNLLILPTPKAEKNLKSKHFTKTQEMAILNVLKEYQSRQTKIGCTTFKTKIQLD